MRRFPTISLVIAFLVWLPAGTGCSDDSSGGGSCGNGVCEEGESTTSCPEDCTCGNGTCDEGEDVSSCAEDCTVCGDGQCTGDENCDTCEQDCGACPRCPDGECNGQETCETCPQDCGSCAELCGNGVLDANEDCDGTDLFGEDCVTQGYDAGTLACDEHCLFDYSGCVNYECGNGTCDPNEDGTSCPEDCPAGCGDGTCNAADGETCATCAADCQCGEMPCGDFLQEAGACQDAACVAAAYEQVCSEAQDEAAAVLVCAESNCGAECADMSSDGCQTCLVLSCGSELVACSDTVCPGTCGDGVCDPGEEGSCPEDCPVCGDGVCSPAENGQNCPDDCGSTCGDGVCTPDEGCESCPADCGTCGPSCGDGDCDPAFGEACTTCPSDCECGDQTCSQVMGCLQNCANDPACVDGCFQTGCAEAQNQAQALYQCVLTNCSTECGQDLGSQACQMCAATSCSTEATACYNGGCSY